MKFELFTNYEVHIVHYYSEYSNVLTIDYYIKLICKVFPHILELETSNYYYCLFFFININVVNELNIVS